MLVTEWDETGTEVRTVGHLILIHKKIEWIQTMMRIYPDVVFESSHKHNIIYATVDDKDFGGWKTKEDIGWIYQGKKNTWLR
jgi:hypothetical protein